MVVPAVATIQKGFPLLLILSWISFLNADVIILPFESVGTSTTELVPKPSIIAAFWIDVWQYSDVKI